MEFNLVERDQLDKGEAEGWSRGGETSERTSLRGAGESGKRASR